MLARAAHVPRRLASARHRSASTVRLLPRSDLATLRSCDALATSANAGLVGNANPNFWRFSGRRNADGALHRAAGPRLLEACTHLTAVDSKRTRCRVGEAVVTPAFCDVHASMIVHAVAPDGAYAVGLQRWWGRRQWSGTNINTGEGAVHLEEAPPHGEADDLLARTYASVFAAAEAEGARSLGLPAFGCGVLGFKPERAADIFLRAFAEYRATRGSGGLERIDVALYSDAVFHAWRDRTLAQMGPPRSEGGAEAQVYEVPPCQRD